MSVNRSEDGHFSRIGNDYRVRELTDKHGTSADLKLVAPAEDSSSYDEHRYALCGRLDRNSDEHGRRTADDGISTTELGLQGRNEG